MKKWVIIFSVFFISIQLSAQSTDDAILVDVDVKPTWISCEDETNAQLRQDCFEKNLALFFNDFIIYPEKARKKKIEGQVIVQFVVEPDGSVSNIQVIRDIGDGCGDEVVRAIQHLPKLAPGSNQGSPARVLYKAPFNFKLK